MIAVHETIGTLNSAGENNKVSQVEVDVPNTIF